MRNGITYMKNKIRVVALLLSFFLFILPELSYCLSSDSIRQYKDMETIRVYASEAIGSVAGSYIAGQALVGGYYCLKVLVLNPMGYDVMDEQLTLHFYYATLLLGPPIGVIGSGRILNQKGSCTGALIGSIIGTGAAAYIEMYRSSPESLFPFPFLSLTCAHLGPIIGYNYKTLAGDFFRMPKELYDTLSDVGWSKIGLFSCIVLLGLAGLYLM
jgi:hypothetical protein